MLNANEYDVLELERKEGWFAETIRLKLKNKIDGKEIKLEGSPEYIRRCFVTYPKTKWSNWNNEVNRLKNILNEIEDKLDKLKED